MAGLSEVPTLIREIPDESALAMALIENIQRENLNPLEEAQGLQRLIDEFSMTHQQAADAVGRSRPAASNLLRLLQLVTPVQEMLMRCEIDMGHARALLPLSGALQVQIAQRVVQKGLSVRETERLAQNALKPQKEVEARNRIATCCACRKSSRTCSGRRWKSGPTRRALARFRSILAILTSWKGYCSACVKKKLQIDGTNCRLC